MYKLIFFWILLALAIFSWISLYLILHEISPIQSPQYAFPALYSSAFLAITFTVAILYSLIYKTIIPTKSSYMCLKNGIRFGIITSILFIIAMIFQQNNALTQTEIITLIILNILIEIINILNQ